MVMYGITLVSDLNMLLAFSQAVLIGVPNVSLDPIFTPNSFSSSVLLSKDSPSYFAYFSTSSYLLRTKWHLLVLPYV